MTEPADSSRPPGAAAAQWRLPAALAVFAAWMAATVLGTTLASPGHKALVEVVGDGPGWGFLAAVLVLAAAARLSGWRDLGLSRPAPGSWRLLAFPSLYLLFFAGTAAISGLPRVQVLGWLALNTLLVAISEELMFRGILLRALVARFSIRPAVSAASLLFGAIHLLNAFATGDPASAAVQAAAATMSGVLLAALALRSGSLLPGILYHWLWNLGAFAVAAGSAGGEAEAAAAQDASLFALFFVVPNFLCGLFLLRGAGRSPARLPD